MTNVTVQEALKAAQKVICEGIYSEDGMDGDDGQKALLAIDAALAEIEKCEAYCEVKTGYPSAVHWLRINDLRDGTKLYTSPISKEWVGLSKEDIDGIPSCSRINQYKFAYAIEAKLKQLNKPEKG